MKRSSGLVSRHSLQLLLVLALALILLSLGITAPFVKDAEPQSAQWIADIVNNGNWLVPHDYYQMVLRKPPLFYWLAAIFTDVTGGQVDEFKARAISLLAGALLATEVWAWTATRLGTSGGWLAFTFLLGMYGFASRATTALTDMLMTLLLFSAYIVMLPQLDGLVSPRRTVIVGVLLGLGLLTKGPVTLALLALAVLFYMLLIRSNPLRLATRPWPWVSLALGFAIAATWYTPALFATHRNHLGEVLLAENIGHFLPSRAGGTGEAARPIYYIALRIIGGTLPMSLLLPALALMLGLESFTGNINQAIRYQLAMVLAVLVLFSSASAKRDDYILPALPPLAILFAAPFVALDQTRRGIATAARDVAVGATAITILVGALSAFILTRAGAGIGVLGSHLNSSDESYAALFAYGLARLTMPFAIFLAAIAIGAAASLSGLWRARPIISGAGFGLLSLAGLTLWTGTLKPAAAWTRSLGRFAAAVHDQVGSAPVFVPRDDPEFSWYYGRGVPAIPRLIASAGPPSGEDVYFVARPGDLAIITPLVRRRMRVVIQSHVLGGGGPPALYILDQTNESNELSHR